MIITFSVILCVISVFGIVYGSFCGRGGSYYTKDGSFRKIEKSDSYAYLVNDPAFQGFGSHMLPWNSGFLAAVTKPLSISYLMPKIELGNLDNIIDGFNFLIDCANQKELSYYSFYSKQQMEEEPSKKNMGILFLRGKAGAPFAFLCPGGGFVSVEANHEGYPVAKRLHEQGYNVFILFYRVKGDYKNPDQVDVAKNSSLDAGNALRYIETHAKEFQIQSDGYSMWGFSAGGYIVASLSNPDDPETGYAKYTGTAPAAAIMGYPAITARFPTKYSAHNVPSYIAMCKDDQLIPFSDVEKRVNEMRALGTEVEFRAFETGGHGFGCGAGTPEDGWMKPAIAFWNKQAAKG